jgi:hypothetical protein
MDLTAQLAKQGGAKSELYTLMHKTSKAATALQQLWDNKTHFRNHLMAEKEGALKGQI